MFTSGRSEMVTKIVGDINATLVRKLEELEHRVLMRIENLQRYEEQTMASITARVDALERSTSSMRFQNEMIQDELDELERLLLREYAQTEMSRTITSSCQNIAEPPDPPGGASVAPAEATVDESPNIKPSTSKTKSIFAQTFSQKIFEKHARKSAFMSKFAEGFARRIVTEKGDVLTRAAGIARTCGSPAVVGCKTAILRALVLHMAARIISEKKAAIMRAREAREKAENIAKLNTEFTKTYVEPTAGRSRCVSDHGYDHLAYPASARSRLYSRPIKRYTPEPRGNFQPNVQRRGFGPGRARSVSPDTGRTAAKSATYRFPAIRRYASIRKAMEANLIDLSCS